VVHAGDQTLDAKRHGDARPEARIGHERGVERHLVRAGADQTAHVVQAGNAAANGQG
jgi:hypothetical protein